LRPIDETTVSAVSNEVSKLRQAWKLEAEKVRELKSFSDAKVQILKELLNKAPVDVVEAEFRRICSTMVPTDSESPFDCDTTLLHALVARTVEQRDREAFVTLLSANCPIYVGFVPLEFHMATTWPDATSLLFDSYAKAKSDHSKTNFVFCLGRAFASLRKQFSVDDAFVVKAKSWFAENRSNVQVNQQYPHATLDPRERLNADKNLFLSKQ